ncbi:hypothetical protein ACFLYT_01115 [Nanoarchaeota archaeon]
MIETKDWISLFLGMLLTTAGALPLLNKIGVGPSWFSLPWMPLQFAAYIIAIAGFYLMVESVIEITNSNTIGWISFLIAVLIMAAGILQVLNKFGIGPDWFSLNFIKDTVYLVIFVIEGLFLMIAMFAMEM